MVDEKQTSVELSSIEKSAIGEVCDLMTASLARAFGEKLGSDVGMNPSEVNAIDIEGIEPVVALPALLVNLHFKSALEGQFFLFISGDGLPRVFDLATSDDTKETDLDDDEILSALKTIMNGAVSDAMTSLAESMGYKLVCMVTDAIVLQEEGDLEAVSSQYPEGNLLGVVAALSLADSSVNIGYLLPVSLGNQIIELLLEEQQSPQNDIESVVQSVVDADTEGDRKDDHLSSEVQSDFSSEQEPQVYDLQRAKFDALSEDISESGDSNISLLLDVALDATIELGKTQMTIEDILRLTRGSVIELDKLASEPVDFLVNGKPIARGEVVVIDDNFGIRITEILSPKARLESI